MGGTGYGGDRPTTFMYPGDPVTLSFWSQLNTDEEGSRNTSSDSQSLMSTGPFRLEPDETEEIVLAIVWARGDDYLDSVAELREADRTVQDAWNAGTIGESDIPPPPTYGPPLASPADEVSGQPLDLTLSWNPQTYISEYKVEIATTPNFNGTSYQTLTSLHTTAEVDSLQPFTDYFWRVTSHSPFFDSPPSETRHFRTSDVRLPSVGLQTIPGTNNPAFLEVRGPGGSDPCAPTAMSTDGCAETGGNYVFDSENSTGEFVLRGGNPQHVFGDVAPNDVEIRFTEDGSYARRLPSETVVWVPFEVWDVGPVGFFNENDPSDDVQFIPTLYSGREEECEFGYTNRDDFRRPGFVLSDPIYAFYATSDYDDWASEVGPLVEASADRCYVASRSTSFHSYFDDRIAFRNIAFAGDPESGNSPGRGTIVRLYTTPPPDHSPIPAAPGSGTGPIEQPLELVWNAHEGNTTSQIQISSSATFDDLIFDGETTDETFVISGLTEGRSFYWRVRLSEPESPWSDPWTFTVGEATNVSADRSAELPAKLTLDQNYPNPFNPSTTIRFGLPEIGPVKIRVYDLLGRRVATLIDRPMTAGWHDVTWEASAHASGVYVYSLETGERRITKSLVVVK